MRQFLYGGSTPFSNSIMNHHGRKMYYRNIIERGDDDYINYDNDEDDEDDEDDYIDEENRDGAMISFDILVPLGKVFHRLNSKKVK